MRITFKGKDELKKFLMAQNMLNLPATYKILEDGSISIRFVGQTTEEIINNLNETEGFIHFVGKIRGIIIHLNNNEKKEGNKKK